ncbi:ImmA/IrrE family metallo-endopeptidase [Spirosoma rhododendri]|uniref:ImmA/IrrE family metallo-endopeptidase n=1 Tax=Spirosoma rhododendri TaxID=2728024 RepID=A0A7L5DY31_9BACT|nr:ImmA/IrrE family metallo-endopeptidase [Spirosoma rhododendri]QJD81538.1 ImmA/IrrE family metallo-endopeptidase [Spirosoma rhododendri]
MTQKASAFDLTYKDALLAELKKLFLGKNVLDKLPTVLQKYGILLIVRSKPDHAPLDGAAFWSKDNPVIALTLRYQRYDNLIFTVYHELGHIFLHLCHDKESSFVDSLDDGKDASSQQEDEANEFARNTLVPSERWRQFTLGRSGFTDEAIQQFADSMGVPAPTIWGRLCFEGRMKYSCASVHQKRNQIP